MTLQNNRNIDNGKKSNRRIIADFALNILGSLIYTVATQLITYPYLSRVMSETEYGYLLLLMGIANAVGVSLGNSLNNARLLRDTVYLEEGNHGDFNVIFSVFLAVDGLIVFLISSLVFHQSSNIAFQYTIVSLLIMYRSYFSVGYRTKINYKKQLISNAVAFLGYLLGVLFVKSHHQFYFPFLFGELLACSYLTITSPTLREPFKITKKINGSLSVIGFLLGTAALSQLMLYLDRFLIFPFLGPEYVSIYNVSSFLGKMGGIIILPITGVMLTYFSKRSHLSLHEYYRSNLIMLLLVTLLYVFILLFGPVLTHFMYPNLSVQSLPYSALANLGSCLFVFGSVLQPAMLRFCHTAWQILIQILYLIVYLGFVLILTPQFGLYGFCYGVIGSNTIRILAMFIITDSSLRNNKLEDKGNVNS